MLDAYTYLNLNANNEWGIKPSIYNSKDILSKTAQTKPPTFVQKKQLPTPAKDAMEEAAADDDDDSEMDWEL